MVIFLGPTNNGTACFVRFKDIHSLVNRIMYNKSKREVDEEVIYSRFVLSSIRVKTLHPSQEETTKKKKKRKEVTEKKKEELEGTDGESPKEKKEEEKKR